MGTGSSTESVREDSLQNEVRDEALAWIEQQLAFETEISGAKLKPSSCPVVPFAFQSALTDDSFGISFKQKIAASMSVEELQAAVDYMWVQRLELPFQQAVAMLPSVTFGQHERGQNIRLTYFDGKRLAWTVEGMVFSGLCADAGPSCWEARRPFTGTLHFDCAIQLEP
ncbi:unnamed protein product [Effrenium voratum]|nr:unnamed protein product [Effrenium voratum]